MKKRGIFLLAILTAFLTPIIAQELGVLQYRVIPIMSTPDFSRLLAYPVVRIVDGDTFVVEDSGKQVTVRLVGIDTPETVHPSKPVEHYGKEASDFAKNLLRGEKVYLVDDPQQGKTDRFGRTLAHVYRAPEGLFVNAEIIRQGYGRADTRFPCEYLEQFKQLERFAKKAEKGLWAAAQAVEKATPEVAATPPKEDKAKRTEQEEKEYQERLKAHRDYFKQKKKRPRQQDKPKEPQSDVAEVTVYVTRTGECYHRGSCSYLRKSKIPMKLSEARLHYRACSRCSP